MNAITFSQSDASRLQSFMDSDRCKAVSLAHDAIHICVSPITGFLRVTMVSGDISYTAFNCDDVTYESKRNCLYMWRNDTVIGAIYGVCD